MNESLPSPDLDEIVEEFTRRCRIGERPTVQEYAEQYPEHAEEILDLFPTLLAMEQAAPESDDSPPDHTLDADASTAALAPSHPQQLGDYRIVREIGRGGMGVVYEAEQESLGRHVALKILPQRLMADSKQRRRFKREARAAARLHHTNIVPVFGVGEADGISYYAMQFISGMPLNDVLSAVQRQAEVAGRVEGEDVEPSGWGNEEVTAANLAHSLFNGQFQTPEISDVDSGSSELLDQTIDSGSQKPASRNTSSQRKQEDPASGTSSIHRSGSGILSAAESGISQLASKQTYWQSVARIGQQAAEALGYAHSQGVIHRDIKPGNLLLDLAGTVWITDFGLAKAEEEDDLTKTGDVLGTLRYMPPEALKGVADARSDIFSLGLTLYELVAQRPAYEENDRRGLLQRISHADVTRLQSIDRHIPRDLETIIHKSVAADSKDRYQDAEEMAADLERYLSDEPIHARRMSLPERFNRWGRRNPVIAGLGAACTALLLAISVVSTFAYIRTTDALDLARQREVTSRVARDQAEVARDQAEAARDDARQSQAVAETATAQAVRAKQDSEQAREQSEATTYRRNVSLALSQWREGHSGTGIQLLDECPEEKRGLEWRLTRNLFAQYDWKVTVGAYDMTVMADGNHVALAVDGGISIRSLQDGEQIRHIKLPRARRVCGHPLQNDLVVSDKTSKLHVVAPDGKIVREQASVFTRSADLFSRWMADVVFSPDGKQLAVVGNGQTNVQVFSWPDLDSSWTANGDLSGTSPNSPQVLCAAFTPDSENLVTCSSSGDIIRWDTKDRQEEAVEPKQRKIARTGGSHAIDISTDGKQLLLGQINASVRRVSFNSKSVVHIGKHRGTDGIYAAKFLNGGQLAVSGGTDNVLKIWNHQTRELEHSLIGHHSRLRAIDELHDGSLISMCDETLIRWPRPVPRSRFSEERVTYHPTESLIAVHENGEIKIQELGSRRSTFHVPFAVNHPVQVIRFSPDGRQLLAAGTEGGSVWDWSIGERVTGFGAPVLFVDGMAQPGPFFTADSDHLIFIRKDGELVVLETDTGNAIKLPEKLRRPMRRCIATAPRSRLAAAVFDGQITVFDPLMGTIIQSIPTQFAPNGAAGFSPDEKHLLVGYRRRIDIFDLESGERVKRLDRHWGSMSALAFSHDGTRLVTGGTDCEVNLWEWPSAEHLLRLESEHRVSKLEFDCRDHWLSASGWSGSLNRVWDARPAEEIVDALRRNAIQAVDEGPITNSPGDVRDNRITRREAEAQINSPPLANARSGANAAKPGNGNYALEFDAQSSCVDISSATIHKSQPVTIEATLSLSSLPQNATMSWPVHAGLLWLTVKSHGKWAAEGMISEDRDIVVHAARTSTETVKLAAVYDQKTLSLFVNGVRVKNQVSATHGKRKQYKKNTTEESDKLLAESVQLLAPGRDACIGKSHFYGIIDEVRISNIARYTENYTPVDRFENDEHTRALYHFDEGTGNVLFDSSGNHHHGTIRGARWVNADGSAIETH
ncbi:Serine/threonine-protein kinase PrkC [Stieleria neptunia]|uniref:Serine/threonine-protein kinase PrkC n=1 Tax=Stieleria neptunia TaxID=2527979 RepID=A0A518HP08_9BACT|nr:WD40 repeat domain-containing serine/threonine-protein kinase [Stieleria neptunia]QDV42575.1 Serine/threonine-protein kinase PrkC [Stieleria neptunia]